MQQAEDFLYLAYKSLWPPQDSLYDEKKMVNFIKKYLTIEWLFNYNIEKIVEWLFNRFAIWRVTI